VRVRERERERERERVRLCVCVRKRQTDRQTKCPRQTNKASGMQAPGSWLLVLFIFGYTDIHTHAYTHTGGCCVVHIWIHTHTQA